MSDRNPIGIPQWSIDYWNTKREKLDAIIYGLMEINVKRFNPYDESTVKPFEELNNIVNALKKFRDDEL